VTKDVFSGLTQKAQFIIDYNEQGVLVCKWISKPKKRAPIPVHPVILNFFQNLHKIAVNQNTRSGVIKREICCTGTVTFDRQYGTQYG
jgi:hypothetical protein